jgi:hypothetical protein
MLVAMAQSTLLDVVKAYTQAAARLGDLRRWRRAR